MENYENVMRLVSSNKNVRGVAPFVLGQVLVETEPANTNVSPSLAGAPWLRGVDANAESSVSVLPKSIIAGAFDLSGQSVVIGRDFADNMNLSVGDRVSIYSPADLKKMKAHHGKPDEEAVLPDDYTVTGIFDVGYYDYDANVIVTSLENAQELYNLDDGVHGLMVMLNDPYQADEVRQQLQQTLGPNFNITTWAEENSAILGALIVEKNVMFYLLLFHRARRRALHFERANHLRRPENARNRNVEGTRRDEFANLRHFFNPERHHRRHRRARRLRAGNSGGGLSQ